MTAPPSPPLPIDPLLPEMIERLRAGSSLVVEAPPGAGKTTRVPRALLESGLVGDLEVMVLEPRRLAARLSARRVAEELGEALGERVGYAVRFEEASSPRTRLSFVTHGVLLRRLLDDAGGGRALLPRVGAVVLDEFHERTLEGDLALALLRRAQREGRPDLKLVAMSATLDGEPLARWLGAERVRSEGRRFEVAIEHAATRDERPLEEQVASAVRRLIADGLDGDVLVFLPGAREIRRAGEALAPLTARNQLLVLPLHGDQSPAEQDRAVRRLPAGDGRRKVILSTNVAETSVTIDGVVAVIDSGLARVAAHDPWSGLPTLKVSRVSRASSTQRAGRAGRTRPGRALRLFTKHDHDARPEFETPEIRRKDLADLVLLLHGVGARATASDSPLPDGDPRSLIDWFEAPPPAAIKAAEILLARLGATGAHDALTEVGKRLLRFPLHPRLGRLLVEAEALGVAGEGALAAAILGEGRRGAAPPGRQAEVSGPSDLLAAMELRPQPESVMKAQRSLLAQARRSAPRPLDPEQALMRSVLAGFPDRVARRRRAGEPEVLLSGGGTLTLAPASVVRDEQWMVVLEAEERREGNVSKPTARMASAIDPNWLLDLPDALRDQDAIVWNPRAGRVEATRRLLYDELIVDESPLHDPDPEAVASVLAEAALALGKQVTAESPDEIERYVSRLGFVAAARPDSGIAVPDESTRRSALRALCVGRRSLADLAGASLVDGLRATLTREQRDLVDRLAPERITLPGGRSTKVEYAPGQPPWVASRLQDFFGLAEGPRLGNTPLTLHLLAPNQRAVQVTSDLAGFWQRHYPAIRRELMRRYPRHAWPEDPLHAEPPSGPRRR